MNLTQMTTNVRLDLMDTDPSNQRWTDLILQREIDRAVARYSQINPYLQRTQILSTLGSKVYPMPSAAWWLDRIEYPIGQYPQVFQTFHEELTPLLSPPIVSGTNATVPTFSAAPGGQVSGSVAYAFSFVVPGGGETLPSFPYLPFTAPANSQVVISSIPTAQNYATARNIYRTTAGGGAPPGSLYLAGSIPDNLTTSFTDNMSDLTLVNQPTPPQSNTTQGVPIFEMDLRPEFLPSDNTHIIEVTYCTKHQLDPNGTSIPEKHWDAIEIGAEAYAIYAYLTTQNDNFDWVDGQFRDRVDDTKAPIAWKAQADTLMKAFEDRLREIKAAAEATIMQSIAKWGDKPYRWDRL